MTVPYRKKLIEVALPLEAINRESAREKSIRHGHPSTLHLWWARRPLAAARAVLFAQLVDDPSAWPERFPTEEEQARERKRLFGVIEAMVPWESSSDERVVGRARLEIAQSWARNHPSARAADVLALAPEDVDRADGRALVDGYLATELPPVHDPFAGGGTIPLEAQRLGLRAIASDLNPVAVLINRALIEIPARFAGAAPVHPASTSPTSSKKAKRTRDAQSDLAVARTWSAAQGLAEDVRYYGAWIREEARKRIGQLYPPIEVTPAMAEGRPDLKDIVSERLTVVAYLWARTVASPDPAFAGTHVPLVSSFWLSTKAGNETWVEPIVERREYRFTVRLGPPRDSAAIDEGTKAGRGGFRCLLSGVGISFEYVRGEGAQGRLRERLLAIVAEGSRRRLYLPPDDATEAWARGATPNWLPEGDLPAEALGFRIQNYGLIRWSDLFTARQLAALTTFSDLVREARDRIVLDARASGLSADAPPLRDGGVGATAYADAVTTYLAFCHSAMLDDLSTVVTWRPSHGTGATRTTFARQALPMTWDFAEANPFASAGGDMASSAEAIAKVLEALGPTARAPIARALQLDATSEKVTGETASIGSTDPPYYDNIGYADLSDFFYIWLRKSLRDVYPDDTSTLLVPKQAELIAMPFRHGGRDAAEAFFLAGMTRALAALVKASAPGIPTTVYYAFKQAETTEAGTSSTGWETFLEAAQKAGFEIHGTWPVRTERAGRSRDIGSNALATSVVLVLTPRSQDALTTTRAEFRRALREELPRALRALQHSHIAPVDVAQASIGPGMAVFSRFAKVLEPDGSTMRVRAALRLINEVLDEHLAEHEGEFDSGTRFAVTWYEVHAFDAGAYGDAETLAKARAVAVTGIADAGIIKSGGGKVRLLKRDELPPDWDPTYDDRLTVWEATQHLIKRLEEQGETAAADLLDRLGGTADAARDLAYRLYSTCERKGWADEARAYNGLVAAWSDLEKLAASRSGAPAQQKLI